MRKIGVIGYGNLGKYLVDQVIKDASLQLAFVYNRDLQKIPYGISRTLVLKNLDDISQYEVDLIVEVAHPKISESYGISFLKHADYMVGSPTVFGNEKFEKSLCEFCSTEESHALYIPKGAMWYLDRVLEMVATGRLKEMNVTMKKHPLSVHYQGPLDIPLKNITKETIIYDGNVRKLCKYAPNNVNTMAVAALASQLGMDNVHAKLVVDPDLEAHIIEVELYGEGATGERYSEKAQRYNPAKTGAVTGSATYESFFNSLKHCCHNKNGLHYC